MTPPAILQWCAAMAELRRRLRQAEPLDAVEQAAIADLLDSVEEFVMATISWWAEKC